MSESNTESQAPDMPSGAGTQRTWQDLRTRQPRIAFQTLGCKLNQYETDALASRFQDQGYTIVDSRAEADCYVVNTCTVTNKGDRKSRNAINRSLRQKDLLAESRTHDGSPSPLVVVTGCFAESHRDELEQDSRLVTVGNEQKQAIVELVNAHFSGEYLRPDELPRDVFSFGVPGPVFHTRSMIKVQDGCDNYCTFCIIPFVRGRARSRSSQAIREELKESLAHGYREIVLTGVNISRYNENGTRFSSLVESLLEIEGDYRIRLSSLEPDMLDERFFDLFAHPRMAPHLHLCLQSGSERILLQMRRQYTAAGYRDIANRLLERYPGFNLTTDCIVGFPGETDEEFEQTCTLTRELGFTHVHTFPYSLRSGTRAERIPGHVSGQVKAERSRQLRAISEQNREAYYRRMIGEKGRLLVERVEQGVAHGYTEQYIPTAVRLPPAMQGHNRFIDVVFRGIAPSSEQTYMHAEPLS
ncbi:MAG: tRNA (N(6)-L-threonylcarbamoyladenosine(37)-C(2))-methylthiotransferase MtaB [Spirochaetota bacterium]